MPSLQQGKLEEFKYVPFYRQVAIYSMFSRHRANDHHREGERFALFSHFAVSLLQFLPDSTTLPAGLLLYLKSVELACVPLKRADERELFLIRNEVMCGNVSFAC